MNTFSRLSLLAVALGLAATTIVPSVQAQDEGKKEPAAHEHPGQVAFDKTCKVCHGPEARGDGAPRLVPFTREYDELLAIIREGTGQMPPISAREISDEQVAQVVEYLKSLDK